MQHIEGSAQTSTGSSDLCVVATGGGAFKYYDEIKRALGVEVLREDEMECLIIGISTASICLGSMLTTHTRNH